MQEGAKRRLAGAVVIVALAVIFVPMLFEEESLAPQGIQATPPAEPNLGESSTPELPAPVPEQATEGASPAFSSESAPLSLPAPAAALDTLPPDQMESAPIPGETVDTVDLADDSGPPAQLDAESEPQSEPGQLSRAIPQPPPEAASAPARTVKTRPQPEREAIPDEPEPQAAERTPPKPASGKESWVVQVASLGASGAADELVGKLKKSGFPAFVEQAEVRGKTYYRVRIGPVSERSVAEQSASKIRQQQKLDALIQRYE